MWVMDRAKAHATVIDILFEKMLAVHISHIKFGNKKRGNLFGQPPEREV